VRRLEFLTAARIAADARCDRRSTSLHESRVARADEYQFLGNLRLAPSRVGKVDYYWLR